MKVRHLQPLLTIEEAAAILHLCRSAIYELIKHEGLPCHPSLLEEAGRIHPEELEQWIEQQKLPQFKLPHVEQKFMPTFTSEEVELLFTACDSGLVHPYLFV